MAIKPVRKTKNPPVLSHEFIIQNHGDIVSCVAMVIVMGLMFQATSSIASVFIILQHEAVLEKDAPQPEQILYTNGSFDFAAIFFYTLIAIVVHAIVQEYILDRLNRKLHLSKTKHSKFNESGQLLLFNAFSACWGLHILIRDESITTIGSLWHNYPEDHAKLSFRLKFYFIIQLAYWLHNYPELYFQKVKKEDMLERVLFSTLHLIFIASAYSLNFTHLGLVLLTFHYFVEAVLHMSRLLHFAEMAKPSEQGFNVYNIIFPVFRLLSLIFTMVTMHMGLPNSPEGLDAENGNFNTPLIRLLSMVSVSLLQGWLVWRFVTFHLRKRRERKAEQAAVNKKKQQLAKAVKKSKKGSDDDVTLLPEVDQNTRRRR